MNKVSKVFVWVLCLAAVRYMILAYQETKPYVETKREHVELRNLVIEREEGEAQIDFDRLKKINPDICAWISIPGTHIDYPVLIGKDNEEYLEKNFKGEYDKLGSVFAFSDMSRDFTNPHICIFAHNMKRPQMFGELKKYRESEFASNNKLLYFYTPGKVEKYYLFSVVECEKTDELFRYQMDSRSEEFYRLVLDIRGRNEQQDIEEERGAKEVEKLITLSTCSEYERTKKRMTVHFVKMKNCV